MNDQLPHERSLPEPEQMLRDVLAGERPRATRRGGWKVPAAAAASVAVVAGAVYVGSTGGDDPQPSRQAPFAAPSHGNRAPAQANGTQSRAEAPTQMVRPLTKAESVEYAQACLDSWQRGEVATQPATVHSASEVPYAWVQRTGSGPRVALVVTAADTGDSYGCTALVDDVDQVPGINDFEVSPFAGPGAMKSTKNAPDATHPAVPTDIGGVSGGGKAHTIQMDGLYIVDDRVAQVRQRYVTEAGPGRWFTADAHGGYVYLFSDGPSQRVGTGYRYTVQTQVLDADGNLLDAPADQRDGGGLTDSPGTTRTDTFHERLVDGFWIFK